MNPTLYHKSAIHPDHQADRWINVQQHIRELHTFLTGTRRVGLAVRPAPCEQMPIGSLPATEMPVETSLIVARERRRLLDCYLRKVLEQSRVLAMRLPDTSAAQSLPLPIDSAYVTLRLATTSAADEPLSVFAGLRRHRHLILIGPDGSGKTTTIHYLAASMAAAICGLDQPELLQQQLEGWQRGPRLPVRVQLAEAVAADVDSADPLATFWAGVPELAQLDLDPCEHALLRNTLTHTLERGQGILLIDGLEQVPDGQALERANALLSAARQRFGASYMLITYRSDDYNCPAYRLNEIESAVLAPLSLRQIDLFIGRWYRTFATQGRYSGEVAQARARSLCALIRRQPVLQAFAASPHHLAMMLLVHSDQGELAPEIIKRFWVQVAL